MRYVELYLDDPRVGCGRRRFFVVKEGRVYAKLFYVPGCKTITVAVEALAKARDIPAVDSREAGMGHGYVPRRVAGILKANIKDRKRRGARFSDEAAKAVLLACDAA